MYPIHRTDRVIKSEHQNHPCEPHMGGFDKTGILLARFSLECVGCVILAHPDPSFLTVSPLESPSPNQTPLALAYRRCKD
jgi:hypothetical protein